MRGGLIIWDRAKLDRLHDAIKACQNGETPEVQYADVVHLWSKSSPITHSWSLTEATSIHERIKAALSGPQRAWPPNNEGPEP